MFQVKEKYKQFIHEDYINLSEVNERAVSIKYTHLVQVTGDFSSSVSVVWLRKPPGPGNTYMQNITNTTSHVCKGIFLPVLW